MKQYEFIDKLNWLRRAHGLRSRVLDRNSSSQFHKANYRAELMSMKAALEWQLKGIEKLQKELNKLRN